MSKQTTPNSNDAVQSKTTPVRIGKTTEYLETPEFMEGIKLRLPVLTVTGQQPGPILVVTAGQHGRELNGIASIYRAFHEIDVDQVKGRVVFLPVMNPLAVYSHRQDFPIEEGRYLGRMGGVQRNFNMNRTWPVDPEQPSSLASSVTSMVWEQYCRRADLLLDLHAWSAASLSLVWGGTSSSSTGSCLRFTMFPNRRTTFQEEISFLRWHGQKSRYSLFGCRVDRAKCGGLP